MSFKKNVVYLGLVQVSQYIIPLITFPYLVRVLGVDGFGALGFCAAIFAYVILCTEYGFSLTATSAVAKNKDDINKLSEIFWTVVNIKFLLAVLSIFILFAVMRLIEGNALLTPILLAFIPSVLGNIFYPVWFFQGIGKMKFITFCTLFSKLLSIPLIYIFVNNPSDVWIAALLQSSTILLSGFLAFGIILRQKLILKYHFDHIQIIKTVKDGAYVFISTVSVNLYTTTTIFILGVISGTTSVGVFNAANTLIRAAISMFNPFFQVLFPTMSTIFVEDTSKGFAIADKAIKLLGGGAILAAVFLFFSADFIIETVVGSEYQESIVVFKILTLTIPFSIINNILGVQTMLPLGKNALFSRIVVIGAILNLVILPPLCYFFTTYGAALSIVIVEIAMSLILSVFNCKIRKEYAKEMLWKPISINSDDNL
jgi:O-antigen flippase